MSTIYGWLPLILSGGAFLLALGIWRGMKKGEDVTTVIEKAKKHAAPSASAPTELIKDEVVADEDRLKEKLNEAESRADSVHAPDDDEFGVFLKSLESRDKSR